MRVICLFRVFNHLTASGGYSRLAPAIGATEIRVGRLTGITSRVTKKIRNMWINTSAYPDYYEFEDWLSELQLLTRCLVNPPDVVHVLFGEHLDLLLRRRSLLRCPLIATFHQPAEQLNRGFEYFQSERIKGIDAAIVVSRNEITRFEHWFGKNKVVYIPHGIDTTQFRPDDRKSNHNKLRLLIVGHWLRDWEVMHRVIDEASISHLDIQFDVVTPPEFFPYFTGCSNVTLHSGMPEPKLIELYQQADALFLPLKDATANNAVLEALACGLPVIATNVGGIPDYVTSDCGWLIPKGDIQSPIKLIKQLCVDKDIARSRREKARAQALKFDWQRIAELLSVVYSAVCAGRPPSTAVNELGEAVRA